MMHIKARSSSPSHWAAERTIKDSPRTIYAVACVFLARSFEAPTKTIGMGNETRRRDVPHCHFFVISRLPYMIGTHS
jgi:hypothetical protein